MNKRVLLDALFWHPNKAGGIQSVLLNTIYQLDNVAHGKIDYYLYVNNEGYEYLNCRVKNIKMINGGGCENLIQRLYKENLYAWWICVKYRVNAVHAFNYYTGLLWPAKTIVTIHDMNYRSVPQTFSYFKRLFRHIYTLLSTMRASRIITVSEFSKKEIIKYLNPRVPIDVVYNATNFELKDGAGVRKKEDFFLSVGSSHAHKNLINLIYAYNEYVNNMRKNGSKNFSNLKIVGLKRNLGDRLKQVIDESPYHSYIELLGYVSEKELEELYLHAKGLVFISNYEGFGIPIIEAMTLECPVICSKQEAVKETASVAGIYVDANDPVDIAEAMVKLESEDFRREFIELGTENSKRFSWRNSAEKIQEVHRGLLEI